MLVSVLTAALVELPLAAILIGGTLRIVTASRRSEPVAESLDKADQPCVM